MKVLLVAPRFPYPPVKGDQLVTYHRLRTLGRRHQLTLLTFADGQVDPEAMEEVRSLCKHVEVVRRPRWHLLANLAVGTATTRLPLQVLFYRSASFRERLHWLLERVQPDILHGILLRVAPYLEPVAGRTVLEPVDSMTLNLERRLALVNPTRGALIAHELWRVRQYERRVAARFPHLVFVSRLDAEAAGAPNATVLPLGVDLGRFRPSRPASRPIIMFTGNMGYGPNGHAATWFVKRCWKAVRESVPDARLLIAGRDPTRAVRELGNTPGVTVLGAVEDIGVALLGARVVVAPMRSGSGMQNKILEAMAAARPVVTTSIGLGDLRAVPGTEVAVEDDESGFARRVVELLRHQGRGEAMGAAARNYVERNHSWEVAADEIELLYARAAG